MGSPKYDFVTKKLLNRLPNRVAGIQKAS